MAVHLHRASAATVSFSTPQEIIISHTDDSIRIGDGTNLVTSTAVGGKRALDIYVANEPSVKILNSNGTSINSTNPLNVEIISQQVPTNYDNGTVSYPTATQEVYSFYQGVTLLKTATLNYTDSTKEALSTWSFS